MAEAEAAEFRRKANACLAMAEKLSAHDNRELVIEAIDMAIKWLDLAKQAERESG